MSLTHLTRSRGARRPIISKLFDLIDQAIGDKDVQAVELNLAKLQTKEVALLEINQQLELKSPDDDVDDVIVDNDAFNDLIIEAKIKANRFLKSTAAATASAHAVASALKSNNKLPKLQIPKFNGEILDWERFWSQFNAGVHSVSTLSKVDKFNYLLSLLTEKSRVAIKGLALTESNYEVAIKILLEKYGQPEVLVGEHIHQLWNCNRVTQTGNGMELRRLYEEFITHVHSLQALGKDTDSMGTLLCHILLQALPKTLVVDWNRKKAGKSNDDLQALLSFLKLEIESLEVASRVYSSCKEASVKKEGHWSTSATHSASALLTTEDSSSSAVGKRKSFKPFCIFCDEANTHLSTDCTKYITNQQRKSALAKARRCFRCLKKENHFASNCRQEIVCRNCRTTSHHTLLCPKRGTATTALSTTHVTETRSEDRNNSPEVTYSSSSSNISPPVLITQTASSSSKNARNISILQTLRVWIRHARGTQEVVALIDGGSERSFISTRIVQQLDLQASGEETSLIRSFGGCQKQQQSKIIPLVVEGSNGVQLTLSALQVPEICHGVKFWEASLIERFLQDKRINSWNQKMGTGELVTIDLLIGADHYWKIMTGHMKRLSYTLMATQSIFGWMIQGSTPMHSPVNSAVTMCTTEDYIPEDSRSYKLSTLWELDSSGIMAQENKSEATLQDVEVLKQFKETTTFQEGRYQVRIPWNSHKLELTSNFDIALERLRRLLWRLKKDPVLFNRYKTALFQYEKDNHAEKVELVQHEFPVYYMPHHAIIKDDRKTTKTRIVFDASSCVEGGFSLNSCQEVGPNLNPPIFNLLLRFRWNKIGITTDLSKAFLQIFLHADDRDATRFLWTDNPWPRGTQPQLQVFRMNRVLFGMKASPFLLAAVIRHHVSIHPDSDEAFSQHIADHTYVDDCLTGEESTQEAHALSSRIRLVMEKGGMQFSKWATNDMELRQQWISEGIVIEEEPIELLKVLGLMWNPLTDELSLKTATLMEAINADPSTKRSVLEILARVFDPLGFLSPLTVMIKCLLQDLWRLKIDWDDSLPEKFSNRWTQWKKELILLSDLKVPRWMQVSSLKNGQLHIFCDAGPRVYATVAYFRYQTSEENFQACLITSKSRLAPIQPMSIPRLELMACLIGSRLAVNLCTVLPLQNLQCYMWSDSKVALKWIEDVPSRWKLFVARRVQEIQVNSTTCKGHWKYCSSKQNIADVITRGQPLTGLIKNKEWWNGPSWLLLPQEEWDWSFSSLEEEETVNYLTEEVLTANVQLNICSIPLIEANKFSSWNRLVRITAWIVRFCNNCRRTNAVKVPYLSYSEIQFAERYWILTLQKQQFTAEYQALVQNKPIAKDSCIYQFNPVLANKMICLGGRLQFARFSEEQKHPFLLKGGALVDLFIQDRHIKTLHGGVQATLSAIRKEVWILRGRQTIRKAIHGCMKCRKWSAKAAEEIEAPLPVERMMEENPFCSTGIDFAGPIYVKTQEGTSKSYICLFTCAVTRAIHLELVSSQHISQFLLAFRRFVARRGAVKIIYSDNSLTFLKADRLLRESYEWLQSKQTQETATTLGIEWKFITPRAAWWGGFYERMVQMVKHHLRRTLGAALLSADELYTLLTEIESVINNRPLTAITEDFSDSEYLTPAHFLLGKKGDCLTDSLLYFTEVPTRAQVVRRWKYRGQLMNRFWKQWRHEYLLQLKSVHTVKRAAKQQEPVQLHDVVLIMEDKLPRGRWKMAKVSELTTGRDGKVRSVLLQTADKTFLRRAVQHVCPLEIL